MDQPTANNHGQERLPESTERQLSGYIFSVSAGLVGVCLTVIGLFRLVARLRNLNSLADNLLGIDALAFLASCLLAYLSLRSPGPIRQHRLERLADVVFLTGLSCMVVIALLIAYELI